MKKVKILVASVLFCAMGYTGYIVYEKMDMSEADRFMQANVEALTSGENNNYNNARAQYCALPEGKEGCVAVALRNCPLSIFCIR